MPTAENQIRRSRIAVMLAAWAVAISLFASGFALLQRYAATADARSNNAATWHAVLCSLELSTLNSKSTPPDKKKATLAYFDGLLVHQVHTTPCGLKVSTP